MDVGTKIRNLPGPILIIGASGFVGSNLLKAVLSYRDDVMGTVFSGDSWRLGNVPVRNTIFLNIQDIENVTSVLNRVSPKTVFDCSSFGAYSFECDYERIHATNYICLIRLLEAIRPRAVSSYIHAGSSSEYGINAAGPSENAELMPNSHYAVSKAAGSLAIKYYGKLNNVPAINLRLYSVYGPYEDSSRLIPVLCEKSLHGELPPFADPDVTRDFVYVEDVVEAFVDAANSIRPEIYGESYNIGTGLRTSLGTLAEIAKRSFGIDKDPEYRNSAGRQWDLNNWYSNSEKAKRDIGWESRTSLEDGLLKTRRWWSDFLQEKRFSDLTKKQNSTDNKRSISAIVACYKDEPAISIMHKRLVDVFDKIAIDYEIIFVNDASPDNSESVIQDISARDPNVFGVTHSRNFGSQAAFRSGMELASKEACVLLDGDLQDPPELIEDFVEKWKQGFDVVYGRRIKRDMPRSLELFYKAFYKLFSLLSEVPMPRDAGDFSLLDRTVVHWILECRERDLFLRGLRAYVGFNQVGVDYVRPERMFGRSTNNWVKNIGWAKKAIFSYTRVPLHMLTTIGGIACIATLLLAVASITIRFVSPESVPKGITFLSLLVMFFGSLAIFGIGMLGEYIGKILEETKGRPQFIRRKIISRGEIKPAEYVEQSGSL